VAIDSSPAGRFEVATRCADDTHGHGRLCGFEKAERVSERDHPLADDRRAIVTEFQIRERVFGLDLDERNVGDGIRADEAALELLAIREGHGDLGGVTGDVVVRDDVPVGRYDESGSKVLDLTLQDALAGAAAEEVLE